MISFIHPAFRTFTFSIIIAILSPAINIKAQSPYVGVTAGDSRMLPENYIGQNDANIIENRSLTNPWLRSRVPQLQPSTIRHVASSQANWWDWRAGWLLQQEDLPPGYVERDDWEVFGKKDDKISDLKYLVDTSGATVLFAPNLMTSRLDYQVAALFEFAYQNLKTPYSEMGSEFYLDNTEANLKFPTVFQYCDTATKWIAGFKSLFPNIKISCIGATEQSNSQRRNTWTQNVIDHVIGFDAISTKVFLPAGIDLPDSIIPKSALPQFFAEPFRAMEPLGEVGTELNKLPDSSEMWVSEYNITDHRYIINGLWAHGLFESALTLSFLTDSRITRISQFRMSGDALHGNIFETSHGFANGPLFIAADPTIHTDSNEFTAVGNAMRLVGSSLHLATDVSPLIFTPYNGAVIPELTNGYSAFCGYKINKPFADEIILLNLSDDSTLLDIGGTLDSSIVHYELLWWPSDTVKRPLIEVTGDMPIITGIVTNHQIYIPPYAILRCYQMKNEIFAKATDDTICNGTSTTILAYGANQYSWNPAVTTTGDQAVAYVSPTTTTTYTVTATEGCDGCTKSVTIHVVEKPVQGIIDVSPSAIICPGTSVTLTVEQTDAFKFCWTAPDVGDQFAQTSITVSPDDTTTYYLFGANDGCYSYRDSVTIYIRPSAHAGPDQLSCIGDTFHLGTHAESGLNYEWSPTTGLNDASIAQPVAVPTEKTSYILKVTDPLAGCSDWDTVTIDPVQCCYGSIGTPVFPPNTTATYFLNSMLNDYGANVNLTTRVLTNFPDEIIINGAFIVDSDFSIFNCPKIKLGEKAHFYITAPNVKFKLDKDSLRACGPFKWSGIINTNVLSDVILDSSYIANADTILLAMRNADFEIRNCYFHDFNCGIEMVNYLETLETIIPQGTIYGTTFEGNNDSSIGIQTEHVHIIDIGHRDQPPNIFRNMWIGANIQNSEASIVNNQWKDLEYGIILKDTFSDPEFSPVFDVSIGGNFLTQVNSFENIPIAILSDYVELTVKNNSFTDCDYGVWARNSVSRDIEVSKNTMTNVFKGVNLVGNRFCNYVIKNNDITTADMAMNYFPIAINVVDLSNAEELSGNARITGNEISTNGLYGIHISNHNGYGYDPEELFTPQVTDNIVHLTYSGISSQRVAAIRLENCLNNAVGDNAVDGVANNNGRLQGMNLFDVSGGHFFCNSFNTLSSGLVFIGTNFNDSTWSNIFIKDDSCFKVGQSTILYGKLNDQSGNNLFACGNQFQTSSNLHLVKMDEPPVNYYKSSELYPPVNVLNFNILSESLPPFNCVLYAIGGDSSIENFPDPCVDTSASHATIQAISQQFPVNGEELINNNEDLLWQVANSCPLDCGQDIFIARALLQTKYDNLIFNDDSICGLLTTIGQVSELPGMNISIYPNPTSEMLTIEYSFAENGIHDLKIADVSSRNFYSYELHEKEGVEIINTSKMSAGCYLLSFYSRDVRVGIQKLVIAK